MTIKPWCGLNPDHAIKTIVKTTPLPSLPRCRQQTNNNCQQRSRGGLEPPIGMKSMQNLTFLVLLRPIFAQKMKTAPPEGIWCRSCKGFVVIRPEEPFEFPISAEKSVSISVKTFFFWRSPVFGRKIRLNFQFWPKNPSQFRINRLNLIQEQWKFGSRSLTVVSLFQKSPRPPFFQILATRLIIAIHTNNRNSARNCWKKIVYHYQLYIQNCCLLYCRLSSLRNINQKLTFWMVWSSSNVKSIVK